MSHHIQLTLFPNQQNSPRGAGPHVNFGNAYEQTKEAESKVHSQIQLPPNLKESKKQSPRRQQRATLEIGTGLGMTTDGERNRSSNRGSKLSDRESALESLAVTKSPGMYKNEPRIKRVYGLKLHQAMELERINIDLFDQTIDKTDDLNMLKSKFQDKAGIYDSNATVDVNKKEDDKEEEINNTSLKQRLADHDKLDAILQSMTKMEMPPGGTATSPNSQVSAQFWVVGSPRLVTGNNLAPFPQPKRIQKNPVGFQTNYHQKVELTSNDFKIILNDQRKGDPVQNALRAVSLSKNLDVKQLAFPEENRDQVLRARNKVRGDGGKASSRMKYRRNTTMINVQQPQTFYHSPDHTLYHNTIDNSRSSTVKPCQRQHHHTRINTRMRMTQKRNPSSQVRQNESQVKVERKKNIYNLNVFVKKQPGLVGMNMDNTVKGIQGLLLTNESVGSKDQRTDIQQSTQALAGFPFTVGPGQFDTISANRIENVKVNQSRNIQDYQQYDDTVQSPGTAYVNQNRDLLLKLPTSNVSSPNKVHQLNLSGPQMSDTVDGRQLKSVQAKPNIPKLHLKAISAERKLRGDDSHGSDSKPRSPKVENTEIPLLNGPETQRNEVELDAKQEDMNLHNVLTKFEYPNGIEVATPGKPNVSAEGPLTVMGIVESKETVSPMQWKLLQPNDVRLSSALGERAAPKDFQPSPRGQRKNSQLPPGVTAAMAQIGAIQGASQYQNNTVAQSSKSRSPQAGSPRVGVACPPGEGPGDDCTVGTSITGMGDYASHIPSKAIFSPRGCALKDTEGTPGAISSDLQKTLPKYSQNQGGKSGYVQIIQALEKDTNKSSPRIPQPGDKDYVYYRHKVANKNMPTPLNRLPGLRSRTPQWNQNNAFLKTQVNHNKNQVLYNNAGVQHMQSKNHRINTTDQSDTKLGVTGQSSKIQLFLGFREGDIENRGTQTKKSSRLNTLKKNRFGSAVQKGEEVDKNIQAELQNQSSKKTLGDHSVQSYVRILKGPIDHTGQLDFKMGQRSATREGGPDSNTNMEHSLLNGATIAISDEKGQNNSIYINEQNSKMSCYSPTNLPSTFNRQRFEQFNEKLSNQNDSQQKNKESLQLKVIQIPEQAAIVSTKRVKGHTNKHQHRLPKLPLFDAARPLSTAEEPQDELEETKKEDPIDRDAEESHTTPFSLIDSDQNDPFVIPIFDVLKTKNFPVDENDSQIHLGSQRSHSNQGTARSFHAENPDQEGGHSTRYHKKHHQLIPKQTKLSKFANDKTKKRPFQMGDHKQINYDEVKNDLQESLDLAQQTFEQYTADARKSNFDRVKNLQNNAKIIAQQSNEGSSNGTSSRPSTVVKSESIQSPNNGAKNQINIGNFKEVKVKEYMLPLGNLPKDERYIDALGQLQSKDDMQKLAKLKDLVKQLENMEVLPGNREQFMAQLLNLRQRVPSLTVNSPSQTSMLDHTRNLAQSQEPSLRNHPKLKNINSKELKRYDQLKEQISMNVGKHSQATNSKYPFIASDKDQGSTKFPKCSKYESHQMRQRKMHVRNSQESSVSEDKSVYSRSGIETRQNPRVKNHQIDYQKSKLPSIDIQRKDQNNTAMTITDENRRGLIETSSVAIPSPFLQSLASNIRKTNGQKQLQITELVASLMEKQDIQHKQKFYETMGAGTTNAAKRLHRNKNVKEDGSKHEKSRQRKTLSTRGKSEFSRVKFKRESLYLAKESKYVGHDGRRLASLVVPQKYNLETENDVDLSDNTSMRFNPFTNEAINQIPDMNDHLNNLSLFSGMQKPGQPPRGRTPAPGPYHHNADFQEFKTSMTAHEQKRKPNKKVQPLVDLMPQAASVKIQERESSTGKQSMKANNRDMLQIVQHQYGQTGEFQELAAKFINQNGPGAQVQYGPTPFDNYAHAQDLSADPSRFCTNDSGESLTTRFIKQANQIIDQTEQKSKTSLQSGHIVNQYQVIPNLDIEQNADAIKIDQQQNLNSQPQSQHEQSRNDGQQNPFRGVSNQSRLSQGTQRALSPQVKKDDNESSKSDENEEQTKEFENSPADYAKYQQSMQQLTQSEKEAQAGFNLLSTGVIGNMGETMNTNSMVSPNPYLSKQGLTSGFMNIQKTSQSSMQRNVQNLGVDTGVGQQTDFDAIDDYDDYSPQKSSAAHQRSNESPGQRLDSQGSMLATVIVVPEQYRQNGQNQINMQSFTEFQINGDNRLRTYSQVSGNSNSKVQRSVKEGSPGLRPESKIINLKKVTPQLQQHVEQRVTKEPNHFPPRQRPYPPMEHVPEHKPPHTVQISTRFPSPRQSSQQVNKPFWPLSSNIDQIVKGQKIKVPRLELGGLSNTQKVQNLTQRQRDHKVQGSQQKNNETIIQNNSRLVSQGYVQTSRRGDGGSSFQMNSSMMGFAATSRTSQMGKQSVAETNYSAIQANYSIYQFEKNLQKPVEKTKKRGSTINKEQNRMKRHCGFWQDRQQNLTREVREGFDAKMQVQPNQKGEKRLNELQDQKNQEQLIAEEQKMLIVEAQTSDKGHFNPVLSTALNINNPNQVFITKNLIQKHLAHQPKPVHMQNKTIRSVLPPPDVQVTAGTVVSQSYRSKQQQPQKNKVSRHYTEEPDFMKIEGTKISSAISPLELAELYQVRTNTQDSSVKHSRDSMGPVDQSRNSSMNSKRVMIYAPNPKMMNSGRKNITISAPRQQTLPDGSTPGEEQISPLPETQLASTVIQPIFSSKDNKTRDMGLSPLSPQTPGSPLGNNVPQIQIGTPQTMMIRTPDHELKEIELGGIDTSQINQRELKIEDNH